MEQKELKNKQGGITLIALVVTIVVLLILAGVSISLVLGNNGLISKAKDARDAYNQGAINDETAMNNVYDEIESIVGSGTGGNGGTSVELSELAIGDYVNYTYDEVAAGYTLLSKYSGYSSDQTVAQSSSTLKWRILNIDESSGKIDLVSESPTSNTAYFRGAKGYNNGVYLLNEMCAELYSNKSKGITARSINLEDTEKHLTATGLAARNAYNNGTATYGSTKTYTDRYSYYPNLYAQEIGSGVNVAVANASSITQPEKSINNPDPYKESKAYYTSATEEEYTQASEKALTVTQTYYNGVTFNEANYGEAGAVLNSSSGNYYWVASRYAYCDSSNANFGLRFASTNMFGGSMFYSYNYTYNGDYRLRPVVSLESNILDGTKDASGAWNLK